MTHELQPLVATTRRSRPQHRWVVLLGIAATCLLAYFQPSDEQLPLLRPPALATVRVDLAPNASSPRGYNAVATFGVRYDAQDAYAYATFNDSVQAIGWSQLWVRAASPAHDDRDLSAVMYAAGYAEGALTHARIQEHYLNTYESFYGNDTIAPAKVAHWLQKHVAYLQAQMQGPHKDLNTLRYWRMLGGIFAQIEGLADGYNDHGAGTPLSVADLFFLNSDGDLEDLIPAINATDAAVHKEGDDEGASLYEELTNLKCSALIRLLPNATDLLWGHTTWDIFSAMNKMFKHYDVPLPEGGARRRISMSSSPGYISSVDDWYLLDSGLAVLETTNGVYNKTLYEHLSTRSVLSWMRSKVANALATDGPTWADTFGRHNSGTYNNQWMILDLHRLSPGVGLADGGLTILEQMPGAVESSDMTHVLRDQGYWASYNVPYFPAIYNATGFRAKFDAQRSSDWTYNHTARAEIFRRDAPRVGTLEDLKHLMRYNDYENDPLSQGNPAWAIAARYDLAHGSAFKLHGGIDSKVSSFQRGLNLECDAILGPTSEQQPAFQWAPELAAPHRGQPTAFKFPFVTMRHREYLHD